MNARPDARLAAAFRWLAAMAAGAVLAPALGARSAPAMSLPPGRVYPVAGASWGEPLDSGVRDLYSGGVALSAGIGYGWPLHGGIELRGAWFRRSAHPADPIAVRSESRLTLIPITLEAHARLPRPGTSPFLLLGPAVLLAREEFTARLLETTEHVTGKRTQWGGVAGIGLEAPTSHVNVRLAARAIVVAGHRQVLRGNARHDNRSAGAHGSLLTAGIELRLP